MNRDSKGGLRFRIWKLLHLQDAPLLLRRVIIGVIGGTILIIGLALIVLPGPAFLVIPLGLGILATEFLWARRWLRKVRGLLKKARDKVVS